MPMIAKENNPINVHQCLIINQLFTEHDSRNTKVSILKKRIYGLQCCSTRENLSIDVSITNVGLILTKLR